MDDLSTDADAPNSKVKQKIFKCRYCEKPFTQRTNCYRHQRTEHTARAFHCPQCPDRHFKRNDNFKRHMESCHKDIVSSEPPRADATNVLTQPKQTQPKQTQPKLPATVPKKRKLPAQSSSTATATTSSATTLPASNEEPFPYEESEPSASMAWDHHGKKLKFETLAIKMPTAKYGTGTSKPAAASCTVSSSATTTFPVIKTDSDCPQCGALCVGALVLPCGHLTCRRCVRQCHGSQLTCSTCKNRLPLPKDQGSADFTSLVQQLSADPVMSLMVNQRLRGQGRQACLCEDREATTLCQDCMDYYCDSCAKVHRKQGATKDHVLQTLSQVTHNASSSVSRPGTDSASSSDIPANSSRPLVQPPSRGPERWRQWIEQEVRRLQAAVSEQDSVVRALNDIMDLVQRVLPTAQAQQQLLQTYLQYLPLLDVTEQNDDNTFYVTLNNDDVSLQVKMDVLQNRLRDVMLQPPLSPLFASYVTSLIQQLQDILFKYQGDTSEAVQTGQTPPPANTMQTDSASSPTPATPQTPPPVIPLEPAPSPPSPHLTSQLPEFSPSDMLALLSQSLTRTPALATSTVNTNSVRATDSFNTSLPAANNNSFNSASVSATSNFNNTSLPATNNNYFDSTSVSATNSFSSTSVPATQNFNSSSVPATNNFSNTSLPATNNNYMNSTSVPTVNSFNCALVTATNNFNNTLLPATNNYYFNSTSVTATNHVNSATIPSTFSDNFVSTSAPSRNTFNIPVVHKNTFNPNSVHNGDMLNPSSMSATNILYSSSAPPTNVAVDLSNSSPSTSSVVHGYGSTHTATFVPTVTTSSPTVDIMTAQPRRVFEMKPKCDGDQDKPWITSIVCTQDGQRLVMADRFNSKVKVVDISQPQQVSASVYLKEQPWALALLDDGLLAATTEAKVIYLLQVAETVTVKSRIETGLQYNGVADHSNNELIVSCDRFHNTNDVARVDIITRSGCVVRTITDSKSVTRMSRPFYLCVVDNHVLVSDEVSNAVYKVNISNGKLVDTLTHPALSYPRQVTADSSGNVYIASYLDKCVLVRTPSGQWRKLLEAFQHSDKGYDYPFAVCVLNSGRLVVSWDLIRDSSLVIAYDL